MLGKIQNIVIYRNGRFTFQTVIYVYSNRNRLVSGIPRHLWDVHTKRKEASFMLAVQFFFLLSLTPRKHSIKQTLLSFNNTLFLPSNTISIWFLLDSRIVP